MYWPALKPSPAKNPSPPAMASALPDPEEIDDGWVVLPAIAAAATAPKSKGKPPRPPPSIRSPSSAPTADDDVVASDDGSFDPTPDDIVRRYLPLRRSLHCEGLPRQIHDADVYGAHPGFLAAVYPAANGRPEWFFFVCRAQCQGGRRRAGPGAYRLGSEARLLGGTAYCHAFRYYEDEADVGSASTKETQWRMDEYGDCRSSAITAAAAFDMVVCKLYPTRGGTIQQRLGAGSASLPADADANKPQLLVRLYLDTVNLGDPRRCRMYAVSDVFAAHPAVLTATFPAANDRCEWFFAVQQPTRDANEDARPRKAGPGAYVPVREGRAVNGQGGDVGYRRVFLYREDDETVRRVSRTEWWMEEYGFGRDFPSGELPVLAQPSMGEDEELVVYKLYIKMVGDQQ